MPVLQYSSAPYAEQIEAAASFGAVKAVNFSGATVEGVASLFTVGGWMRFAGTVAPATIFSVTGQFSLTIDPSGAVSAGFAAGLPATVTSSVNIDHNWHYVAASYLQSPSGDASGTIEIYIDGLQVAAGSVGSTATTTPGACWLGQNTSQLDFASWSIWSTAIASDVIDMPEWGAPLAGDEADSGLVAAFDFANGGASDQSSSDLPVNAPGQVWHTPCLTLGPQSSATPASADALNPGGPAAFSVLAWVLVPAQAGESFIIVTNGSFSDAFSIAIDATGAQALQVTRPGVTVPAAVLPAAAQWTHVAVTYDGSALSVYLDGALQSATPASSLAPIASPAVVFGGGEVRAAWYMQGISVWSTALDADAIASYMDGADPTGVDGCDVFYALLSDTGNTTRETALTVTAATIGEVTSPFTAPAPADTAAAKPADAAAQPGDIALYRVADYKALAAKHGIDVSAGLDESASSGQFAEALGWYERLLDGVPPSLAATLRAEFARNVRIGAELAAAGVRTGGFEVKAEDGHTVVYFHTEDGPQEVGRLADGLDPFAVWCAQIFFDVVSIVMAMLGIVTTAAKVTKAVGLFDDLLPGIGAAAQNAQGETNVVKACNAIFAVLKFLWEWKAFGSLILQLITAKWWSVVFTVLGIVAQIGALVASGGWLIAWKVTQMAVAIGVLVTDLLHMPTAPQSENGAALPAGNDAGAAASRSLAAKTAG